MLEGVVERGTAENIKDNRYGIAGKTGTAKKVVNGRYTNKYYTSFVGYFPAAEPRYSCIVVIDDPKGFQIYGSDVAAPVFKEIADKIFALEIEMQEELPDTRVEYAGIFPVMRGGKQEELSMIAEELGLKTQEDEVEATWVKTAVVEQTVQWKSNDPKQNLVPDVRGLTLRDALFLLENAGLKVQVVGRGRVDQQSITPGTRFKSGTTIKLSLG